MTRVVSNCQQSRKQHPAILQVNQIGLCFSLIKLQCFSTFNSSLFLSSPGEIMAHMPYPTPTSPTTPIEVRTVLIPLMVPASVQRSNYTRGINDQTPWVARNPRSVYNTPAAHCQLTRCSALWESFIIQLCNRLLADRSVRIVETDRWRSYKSV